MAKKRCKTCGVDINQRGSQAKYCVKCARQKNIQGSISKIKKHNANHYKYYIDVLNLYKSKCAICGWQLKIYQTKRGRQYARGNAIHHIKSISEGGQHALDNLILLCPNHHKEADAGVLTPDELKKYQKHKSNLTKGELKQFYNTFNHIKL